MPKEPLQRKLSYLHNFASLQGINLYGLKWESMLDYYLSVGISSVVLRFLLDWDWTFDFHMDWSIFDQHPVNFLEQQEQPIPAVPKAVYGETKYDLCYYDPPEVTSQNLERFFYWLHTRLNEKDTFAVKRTQANLRQFINFWLDKFEQLGVSRQYLEGMREKLSVILSKIFNGAYVGFAVIGIARIPNGYRYQVLDPEDWETLREVTTIFAYETHVGLSRAGYCRVSLADVYPTGIVAIRASPQLQQHLEQAVEQKKRMDGLVKVGDDPPEVPPPEVWTPTPIKLLYKRAFYFPRIEKLHWRGGEHQLAMQRMINQVKALLDQHGVIAQMRAAYVSFACELFNLQHRGHVKYKHFKKLLTPDDLVEKYKRFGCDVDLLQAIRGVVS